MVLFLVKKAEYFEYTRRVPGTLKGRPASVGSFCERTLAPTNQYLKSMGPGCQEAGGCEVPQLPAGEAKVKLPSTVREMKQRSWKMT